MYLRTRFHPDTSALQRSTVALRPVLHTDHDAKRAKREYPIGGPAKRAMDVAIALVALALIGPFMLVIAGLIRLSMGGPVIFAQRRVGVDGSFFTCYKFRTMVQDAEAALQRHLAGDMRAAQEWRETRKLRHDPRIGCIGNALRRSSLDELPQLFNVLRGDMSIVGPRPVVPSEIGCYGAHGRKCFQARPGLTGIWQVSGRNSVSYARRVALDCYYVRNWSMWLDLKILIKTIPAVLNPRDTA